mmetsp:Transcript_2486/g.3664  ORF Transcript_2486/g.3664 Transcript_2486/m.3664 type:complete len:101 (+) Transcript_2486:744-1046(+)
MRCPVPQMTSFSDGSKPTGSRVCSLCDLSLLLIDGCLLLLLLLLLLEVVCILLFHPFGVDGNKTTKTLEKKYNRNQSALANRLDTHRQADEERTISDNEN